MAGMRGSHREDALSEIVGFVLVLAMVVVASTLYLMYVVPAEGREDEITHMNQVQDRFVSYKTSVDGLWLRSLNTAFSPKTHGVSLSTSFDLGTGGGNTQSSGIFLSFMRPIGTAARMRVEPGSDDRISITVDGVPLFDNGIEADPERNFVPLGSLSYHTTNYYWIQQSYWYKMGGIFLEQPGEGVSVKVAPALSLSDSVVTTSSGDLTKIKLNLCLVNPTAESQTIGGTGPLRVETRLRENANARFQDKKVESVKVEIRSDKPEWHRAWKQVFDTAVRNSGLEDPANSWAFDLYDDAGVYPVSGEDWDSVVLEIPNTEEPEGVPDHELKFSLTEAPLQVTFEYDEP